MAMATLKNIKHETHRIAMYLHTAKDRVRQIETVCRICAKCMWKSKYIAQGQVKSKRTGNTWKRKHQSLDDFWATALLQRFDYVFLVTRPLIPRQLIPRIVEPLQDYFCCTSCQISLCKYPLGIQKLYHSHLPSTWFLQYLRLVIIYYIILLYSLQIGYNISSLVGVVILGKKILFKYDKLQLT